MINIFSMQFGSLPDGAGLQNFNTWIEAHLTGTNDFSVILVFTLLGGLAASLLPCVYPLYPVTAGIVKNRGKEGRGTIHALTYYAGMCLMYASFGIIATATGGAFNSILRFGTTNLLIGAVFVVLAFATMGWLYIPLFQQRTLSKSGGIFGTLMMGISAGLLSSACVGPVVISILINLAASVKDTVNFLVVLKGMVQMLVFGMGLGIPFLAIGLFGVKLPKTGKWIGIFQYALGLVIIYFAYTYFEKALFVYGYTGEQIPLIIGLGFAIAVFIYFVQSEEVQQTQRVKRALYGTAILFSLSALIQTMNTGARVPEPVNVNQQEVITKNELIEIHGDLRWHLDSEAAYNAAKSLGKNVFIEFYGSWCTNCKAFSKLTETDKKFNTALQNAVLLKIYDTNPVFEKYKNDRRFPELKIGLPFILITGPNGDVLYKTNDYLKKDEMMLFIE